MATNTLSFLCVFAALAFCAKLGESTIETNPEEIVNQHNTLRREVKPTASNMLEMSWSSEAAANAQTWANGCSMKHSPKSSRVISSIGCGENLYLSSSEIPWSEAVQGWYDEVKDWKYGVGSTNGGDVGHFTQIVWYRSNKVGCAVAHCPNAAYEYFYVCQYCPSGNLQLTHPYKEGPSCGDCPNACNDKLCTNPCPYTDEFSNCGDLAQGSGCTNTQVASWCPASCKCESEIK